MIMTEQIEICVVQNAVNVKRTSDGNIGNLLIFLAGCPCFYDFSIQLYLVFLGRHMSYKEAEEAKL